MSEVEQRRAIVDRRAAADALAALPGGSGLQPAATELLREAMGRGRDEIARRVVAEPNRGRAHACAYAFLADQIVRLSYDFVTQRIYPNPNPTAAERIALVGLGGTGRGEMAPFSDIDLMMVVPRSRAVVRAGRRGAALSAVGSEAEGRPVGTHSGRGDCACQGRHDGAHLAA